MERLLASGNSVPAGDSAVNRVRDTVCICLEKQCVADPTRAMDEFRLAGLWYWTCLPAALSLP